LHALGVLDPSEAADVERAVRADPALAAELTRYRDVTSALGETLAVDAPPRWVWDRLVHSIGAGRFDRFVARFARIFDVTVDRARELLGWIDDPNRWEELKPGSWLVHFPAGPACAAADTGFVRVTAGAQFPWHRHEGEEVTLVLQGAYRDHQGVLVGAGEEVVENGGSEHDFAAEPGDDLIYAVRVVGVDFNVARPS